MSFGVLRQPNCACVRIKASAGNTKHRSIIRDCQVFGHSGAGRKRPTDAPDIRKHTTAKAEWE
jgi:hypothetical protein